jgi:hypothetical protein
MSFIFQDILIWYESKLILYVLHLSSLLVNLKIWERYSSMHKNIQVNFVMSTSQWKQSSHWSVCLCLNCMFEPHTMWFLTSQEKTGTRIASKMPYRFRFRLVVVILFLHFHLEQCLMATMTLHIDEFLSPWQPKS